jgi:hypothetical protein
MEDNAFEYLTRKTVALRFCMRSFQFLLRQLLHQTTTSIAAATGGNVLGFGR